MKLGKPIIAKKLKVVLRKIILTESSQYLLVQSKHKTKESTKTMCKICSK